ncbi:uncharacterized protein LOC108596028 isoform X2 [Drosophila busckii]|uniref:uncharacterized protein LOC108596028 isoform X2 n=1 Tax=Drosophila busckii TaxID=30019 RepID=UPI00083F463D|nr:uncharacterized protein LOC108596028 isoform X2 [Drosophila busckii]
MQSSQSSASSSSIITYSPSKFIARGSPTTIYTQKMQTHANTGISRATVAAAATTTKSTAAGAAANVNTSYYVVKAGQLGSASILSSPPKATTTVASTSTSSATATPTATENSSTISAPSESSMEHSYIRDNTQRQDNSLNSNGLAPARTILVRHAPQCPTCHTYPAHEEASETQQAVPVPAYDEITAKELMNECARIAKYVRNNNSDEQDWVMRISRVGWTPNQQSLFDKVAVILDQDQLARLANDKRQHEAIHRRVSVDKSSSRMRRALASVAWEPRVTQWLHALLMEQLPPSYMASYLDIMQTLKTKLPTLTDKMLFSRPLNNSQELLAPVMKKRWQPEVLSKSRHLEHNAIMVAVPTMPTSGPVPERMQNWYQALASITQVVQITLPNTNDRIAKQNLDQVAETIVSLTRVRIHELRTENPNRGIILVGFNAGAALALQVAMSESVACVICMGFAYNTLRGPRGAPDDRLLDLKTPILFVVGQNSARTSQEEMEGLRERMQSESTLVVVGSADDSLRVPKSKRRIEGVTQSMVDSMVVDEVYEFINKTLTNPPGPRMPTSLLGSSSYQRQSKQQQALAEGTGVPQKALPGQARKRKAADGMDEIGQAAKTKFVPHICLSAVGRPRTRPLPSVQPKINNNTADKQTLSNEEMNLSIENMLEETLEYDETQVTALATTPVAAKLNTPTLKPNTLSLASGTKIKMLPSNHFVQLKTLPNSGKLINYAINKNNSPGIGNIVKTLPSGSGQQIFTLKTPTGQTTQFVTAVSGGATAASSNQQKYTVIKNTNGMTMLQVTKNVGVPSGVNSNMDLSNIIDMPIVFADNEGNIADQQQQQEQQQQQQLKSANAPLIISQKIIKEATQPVKTAGLVPTKSSNIVINKGIQQLFTTTPTGGNKLVYVNRSNIKPITTAATATATSARLPTGATALPIRILSSPKGGAVTPSSSQPVMIDAKSLNLQTIKTTAGGTVAMRAATGSSGGVKTFPQFQVINQADGKQAVRSIYFKSAAGLKPVQMLANRPIGAVPITTPGGAAVRRVVNIGPVTKSPVAIGAAATSTASSMGISLQSSPKITVSASSTVGAPKTSKN